VELAMRLTERQRKLLILAFDPVATAGESANALRVLFRNWIAKYPDGYAFVQDLESGKVRVKERVVYVDRNPYGDVVLEFGKYRGMALRDVPATYLLWVLNNFDGLWPETRTVIERYLGEKE
jgi:hypothetical protein